MDLTSEDMLEMYRCMVLARVFEEKVSQLADEGEKLSMTPHLGMGEEAVSVGMCFAVRRDDIISPHFRGSAARLTRGVAPTELLAAWMGKTMGLPIYANLEQNIIWQASTVLGPAIDIAVGAALAAKLRQTGQVVVNTFGDGTTNRGNFHESLNFAAVFKLPIVFVCINNRYAMSMPTARGVPVRDIADRAVGYGFPGIVVDGNDVIAVYEAVKKAAQGAREGLGPSLIEAKTYRVSPHSQHDDEVYRPRGEREEWEKRDPIKRLRARLVEEMKVSEGDIEEIHRQAHRSVEEGVKVARTMPALLPRERLDRLQSICDDVYSS